MKKLLLLLITTLLFSCSQKSKLLHNLNPVLPNSDSKLYAIYSDCENFNIPDYSFVSICSENPTSDTIIYLSKLDNRFKIQLNVEWGKYKDIRGSGLKYINIVKDEKLLKKINLEPHINMEPTEIPIAPGQSLFCQNIEFMDVNLDSYLDIRILSNRGNSNSFYSFWLYSPLEEVFNYWEGSHKNLVNFNCKDQMIYAVDFWTASYTLFTAYKIDSAKQLKKYAEQDVVKWGEDEIKWKLVQNNE